MPDTIQPPDPVDVDEKRKWGATLRTCLVLVVVVGCGVAANLLMANTPSQDDIVRGIVIGGITVVGKSLTDMIGQHFKTTTTGE